MKYLYITLSGLLLSLCFLAPAQADLINQAKVNEFNDNIKVVASSSDYNTATSLEDIIATVVRVILSALGLIFILLMFLAGNDWVQAAGNEEKVKKSKDTIRNLAIGLALVLIAYALASGFGKIVSSIVLTK
ncbi:MAG: hypothetical protein WC456_03390 [Patescibacteria group bacterium]